MDRQITHTGALIPNATLLGGEKAKLIALGHALDAVLGGSTCVGGLACTPTAPASLQVVIGTGSIMTKAAIDGTNAFGDLGTDSTPVVKQGILPSPLTLTMTPPSAAGYSQVFLIQAAQADQDSGAVLPYYNAANPAQPFNGPANSGNEDVTLRTSACVVAIKPGIAATSGTQVAPAPDPGYTGLYAITLTNGQTQITTANIAVYPGAPFIPVKLPAVPAGVQAGSWVYTVDTGVAGTLVGTLSPVPAALPDGMEVRVKAIRPAAGGDTFNLNGFGPMPILRRGSAIPKAGDWAANDILALRKSGSTWQLAGLVLSDVAQSIAASTRTVLRGNLNVYVNGATGADSNNGLTPATAFASLQGAVDALAPQYDTAGYSITVNVANGTYASVYIDQVAALKLNFLGNIGSPTSVIVNSPNVNTPCFAVKRGSRITVQGFSLGGVGNGLDANNLGQIEYGYITFTNQAYNISAFYLSQLTQIGPITVAASCQGHWYSGILSSINAAFGSLASPSNVTVNFSVAFAVANNGTILANGLSLAYIAGSTGQRYLGNLGGRIFVAGAGANALPGNVAGTVDASSSYQ